MKGTTLFMVYIYKYIFKKKNKNCTILFYAVKYFILFYLFTCFISHIVLGGHRGFSRVIWTVLEHNTGEFPYIIFHYRSFDGEQGKPLIVIFGAPCMIMSQLKNMKICFIFRIM